MPGIEITALPPAASAQPTDVFPADQLPGPVTRKLSVQQILDLFAAGLVDSGQGTQDQILVNGTFGSQQVGDLIFTLSSTLNLPGTLAIQGTTAVSAIINDNTMATASATNLATALSIKTYVDGLNATSVKSVSGTLNRITSTGGVNPVIDISASYVGQSSITTLGTLTTGIWNATPIDLATYVSGNLAVTHLNSGTGASSSTFWRGDGTWAAPSGSGTVNSGLINQLAWYAANGTAVSGLSTAASGVLVTSAGSVPSISTTLPNGLAMGTPASLTLTNGTGLTIAGITGLGTGVATALAANVNGTGAISLTTNPVFITPTLGAATATSLAFSPTTKGIVGTTTNNNADAGYVGEFVTSAVSGVAMTTGIPANVTSISLTAGDWDVYGSLRTTPQPTTTTNAATVAISTVSATLPSDTIAAMGARAAGLVAGGAAPTIRLSLASTTTVYLVGIVSFDVSTMTVFGTLSARRVR